MTAGDISLPDKTGKALLFGLVVFGGVLLSVQVLAIVFGGYEIASRSSLSLPALLLALREQGEVPFTIYAICAGFAWLLLSTSACAALALPVTAAHQPLQTMLLSGLLLTSLGWQCVLIYEYLEGSPGQLPSAGVLILCLVGLVLILRRHSWSKGKAVKPAIVALVLTGLASLGILIGLLGTDSREELQTILVFLLSMLLVGSALHLRQRARRQARDARGAAFLFQAWLQTLWLPTPYFLAYID
jgi:hypothetical protein